MQQQNFSEPLPAFGSGIEFRPSKKAKQQGPSQGPQKSAMLSELSLSDDMDADGASTDVAVQPMSKSELVSATCAGCQNRCHFGDLQSAPPPFCFEVCTQQQPVAWFHRMVRFLMYHYLC